MRLSTTDIRQTCQSKAFTLAEVLISFAISAMTIGGIIYGYVMTAKRAEWSAYSLAAHSLALQRLEQTRTCKWDTQSQPPVSELLSANFPIIVNILDIPIAATTNAQNLAGILATNFPMSISNFPTIYSNIVASNVNFVYATNYTTITDISANPPLKQVRVDCVWKFMGERLYTNTVTTYRGPDS